MKNRGLVKALLLAGMILACLRAQGAVAVVQHVPNHAFDNGATVSCTISSTGASRNLIIGASSAANQSVSVSSVTDSKGNTYTLATGSKGANGTDFVETEVWHSLNATSGVTSVTATFSGSATTYYKGIVCYEVSGAVTFDAAGKVDTGTCVANACNGASVTTATTTGFVLGVIHAWSPADENPASGNEFSSGGDFDIISGDNVLANFAIGNSAFASLISSTAAAHQPSWHSVVAASKFTASTAAYKQ